MIEFFTDNFAQIVGFAGLGLVVFAFQINDRTKIITFQTFSLFLYAIHFYLLGAYTGAAMEIIGVVRNFAYVKYRRKFSRPIIPTIFILILVLGAGLTWQGPISFLPLGGMILGAIAFWQESPRAIRLINLSGPVLWFIYSYLINSYSGMLGMAFILGSICIAIFRYDILGKPEPVTLKDKLKLSD